MKQEKNITISDLLKLDYNSFNFLIRSNGTGKILGKGKVDSGEITVNKSGRKYLNARVRTLGLSTIGKDCSYTNTTIMTKYLVFGVYDSDFEIKEE